MILSSISTQIYSKLLDPYIFKNQVLNLTSVSYKENLT